MESEIRKKLIKLQSSGDTEYAHGEADTLICELLKSLGYKDIVKEYDKIDKWYS